MTPLTLLLTRPRPQAERFARAFAARFGPEIGIVISPLLRIAPGGELPSLADYAGLVFSSQNGVRAFAGISGDRRLPAYCVGARTAEAAREIGLRAEFSGADAEALVARLAQAHPGGRLLHLRGAHARGEIAARLSAAGQPCDEAEIYDQIPQELSLKARDLLRAEGPVLLPLFSPRSATLAGQAVAGARAPLALAAMSAAVAGAWRGPAPALLRQAEKPDAEGMLDALAVLIAAARHLEGGGGAG
ncbi:uroporphyrinogen-III synthase [Actibacterium sp. MT2.3-13A]|uniref:uroporphyrinogen-III synthase n=1 Tax=Actibacterium sp. MT2.3-13A TaxID=2828332 RepID=UPI001BAD7F38|nr:uroporphyrinogen-III synthase [Actibacterium sp. MT2.3-13A]